MTTTACFTVIESRSPARIGKIYSIGPDGKLVKSSVASITKGRATTLSATPKNIVDALSRAAESDNMALILDSFRGAGPGEPAEIQMVTEDKLKSLTGAEISAAAKQGFFVIESAIVSARLKRLMQSSGCILIDADNPPGMPESMAKLTLSERLTRLEPVLPGISTSQRIEYLGSSARVINGTGAPKSEGTHAIIAISDPTKITLLRDHVRIETVRHDLSFWSRRYSRTEPNESVGHARLTLIDLSVWSPGRLIFNAKPDVARAPGYRVLDAGVRIVNPDGGALDINWIKPPDTEALKQFRDKTGLDIRLCNDRGGGLAVHEHGALKFSTEIESRGTVRPLADWLVHMLDGDISLLRCETPFRASTSEAAFIRIPESGEAFVHDSGTATSFYLPPLDEKTTDPNALKVIAAKARRSQRRTAALLGGAAALQKGDEAAVLALMRKAAENDLTGVKADMLIAAIAKSTRVGLRTLRNELAKAQAEARKRAWEAGVEERQRLEAEREAERQQIEAEEHARLWRSCSTIASSKTLLRDMETVAHQLGVVGEGPGVRALYLTYSSRLLAGEAVRLLRLGAPASGKNVVVEKVLELIPKDAVVQISGSSPKALAYFGGADEDALKHKIVYIPEAQIMAAKRDIENEFAIMLRTLISEGRVIYQTVVVQDGGPPATMTMVKNGPIAAVVTTARDVDPELKTRVMVMDTDETGAQTVAIAKSILAARQAKPDLQPWLDFQLWLESEAPYRVAVPFKQAIFQAFERWRPGFLKGVALRIRRDLGNFISAIEASAVVHRAQRETSQDGAIVATLDDYRHAHEAFDEGLAAVHGKVSEKVIAVVAAIEAIRAAMHPDPPVAWSSDDPPAAVKVTLRDLATQLRVASPMTAAARLEAASA
jgi:hypothetical protein